MPLVRIALRAGAAPADQRALYRRIVEILAERPGLRAEDVFITLIEVARENWSFGQGIAQYVPE